jgi:hypothetical protein
MPRVFAIAEPSSQLTWTALPATNDFFVGCIEKGVTYNGRQVQQAGEPVSKGRSYSPAAMK